MPLPCCKPVFKSYQKFHTPANLQAKYCLLAQYICLPYKELILTCTLFAYGQGVCTYTLGGVDWYPAGAAPTVQPAYLPYLMRDSYKEAKKGSSQIHS